MTTNARDRRAESRRRRRVDEDAQPQDDGASTPGHLQDALKGVASAAAVGAAVGAARAYSARRRDDDEPEGHEPEGHEQDDEPEAVHDEPDPRPENAPAEEQPPVDRGDLHDAVAQARRLLEDLRGAQPESVSSVSATRDGWLVGLEVVEVHRIPDSTDVLATYEVELGGDGAVRRFERTRRYHRSEADRGGRS